MHSPADSTDPGVNARPRGRPREDSDESAQSQPPSAPDFEKANDAPEVTKGDGIRGIAAGFSPPDIWSTDRPALRDVWAYAARGDWTRDGGAPRRVGQAYALLIALPVVGLAYGVAWAAERGTRLIALIVLIVLLAQVPPLAWVL
ncbi:hypothetical protein BJF79_03430 [Actinomadura sp. CNU-125]|uniref:DUF1634 domain-containing protein n=1 Tax=Actinomadura sp. CNU-125 TaxID=1904961 RepID=UPI00095E5868|nr:DUF1634 domain-containing protein [Actinomadura sp. CNU-125]OLT12965.1 hypothetical protein BJF79_03430 [Actinomadura sp. CNU-125]